VHAAPVLTHDTTPVLTPPATTVLLRQPPQRRGRAAAYAVLAVATIAVFVVALVIAKSLLSTGGGDVNTPNVIGLSVADARAMLVAKGLRVGKTTYEYDNSGKYAFGEVFQQTPQPDILLSKGQPVDLVVSKGVHMVTVPTTLVGLTQAEAKRALAAAGLKVAQVIPRSSDQPAGQVLDTNPPPGTQVPIGSGVQLVVSNGKVAVPQVVGETVAQATQDLEQAGFQVKLTPNTSTPDAHVISQDPAAGSFASYGSTVTLQTDAPPPSPTPTPSSPTPTPTDTTSEPPSPTPSDTSTF
jgi:serine/threonine-protein kinase